MPTFAFRAEVTISLSATVEAETEDEAREKLGEFSLQSIDDPGYHYPGEEWRHSGELDGEVVNIELTEAE